MPQWRRCEITCEPYKTQSPITLRWRDGLEVIRHLFSNPIFASCMDVQPYRDYFDGSCVREWGFKEFMSANVAWEIQDRLPEGHTFLGVIGTCHRVELGTVKSDCEKHALLLSIANIHADMRRKEASHAYALAAYIPVPNFSNVSASEQSILARRVYHRCLDIILAELKRAERHPRWMLDPNGQFRLVHTPLVAWVADCPDQSMVAGISPTASALVVASSASKPAVPLIPIPPHMRQRTLEFIYAACSRTDPWDLHAFSKTAPILGFNGVIPPFWRYWGAAEPSAFLMQDVADHWRRFFYRHCLKWIADIIGGPSL
ncbi:hypothetical protein BV25DRAFT_1816397, partial [Artomyces pyxidatus]